MRHIIYNCIRTPDGTELHSRSVHDYCSYTDANGGVYVNDGGNQYLRRSKNVIPATDLTVYADDDHELIREVFKWGTYGKSQDFNRGCTYVPISKLSNKHVEAIIETQAHLPKHMRDIFEDELEYRLKHSEYVEEVEDYRISMAL
jgi:hypothetical protein